MSRLLLDIRAPRTYARILYLLIAFPIGLGEFVFLVTAISFGTSTVITLIGIPVLIGTMFAWRWLAGGERRLIELLLDMPVRPPYRPVAPQANWWARLRAYSADPATWKDLAFLGLRLPLGIVTFALALAVLTWGLGLLFLPAYAWAPGDWSDELGVFGEYPACVLGMPAGLLVLLAGIPALNELGKLCGSFGIQLLGSNEDPQLTAQVSELRDARARVIAAADAERRRLERDLHDGAQQRLVALALTLRMAEQRAAKGDEGAAELVRQAGEEAGLALTELRDLARGIHPAILTNRGLSAALDDLASRAPLPVTVIDRPEQRLPDAVEAAAYFVVSECLANVAKHAQATAAEVSVRVEGELLRVEVRDDGVGGVELDSGSGLQGLQDRVGALDGAIAVNSPVGVGTNVLARIPLDVPADDERPAELEQGPRVLADDEAERRQRRRLRLLWVRLGIWGAVGGLLVLLWALTGAPDSVWFVWPLIGIGLVAGLDAWSVVSLAPLRESAVGEDESDRVHAAKVAQSSRWLHWLVGAFAILELALIALWLAAGNDYFWPIWPLLGFAIAIGVKAAQRYWLVVR
jgi:signal transduction histidine kinase